MKIELVAVPTDLRGCTSSSLLAAPEENESLIDILLHWLLEQSLHLTFGLLALARLLNLTSESIFIDCFPKQLSFVVFTTELNGATLSIFIVCHYMFCPSI